MLYYIIYIYIKYLSRSIYIVGILFMHSYTILLQFDMPPSSNGAQNFEISPAATNKYMYIINSLLTSFSSYVQINVLCTNECKKLKVYFSLKMFVIL